LFARSLLVLGGLAVGWALAETLLAFLPVASPRSGKMVPRGERTVLRPGTVMLEPHYSGEIVGPEFRVPVRMNALGFRERELAFGTLRATRPILFVGDSYFFGWGVRCEERVTEVFADLLAVDGDAPPIVNLSFPGWGTRNYLHVVEAFGDSLGPRLAVIGLFVGNDFHDDYNVADTPRRDAAREGFGFRVHEWKRSVRASLRKSRVIHLVYAALWKSAALRRVLHDMDLANERIICYEEETSSLQTKLFDLTRQALAELGDWCRESEVPLVVVLIPDHLQVVSPETFEGLDMRKPQRVLTEFLAERGVPVVDLLEPLAAGPRDLYYERDKHWTPAGHAFVAEVLARELPVAR
jgi:hypothetical protein